MSNNIKTGTQGWFCHPTLGALPCTFTGKIFSKEENPKLAGLLIVHYVIKKEEQAFACKPCNFIPYEAKL
jgi:hypothetical protein